MKTFTNKILDVYLKFPISSDLVILVLIWIISSRFHFIKFTYLDKANLISLIGSIISSCISLAGFLLAALTIIVTFRSNLKAKGVEMADNALEFIVNSNLYNLIVEVYIKAIYEFSLVTFFLYIAWLSAYNITDILILNKIAVSGIVATSTTVWRSLWVLFKILRSERLTRQ